MKYRSWIIVLVIIGIVLGIGAYLVVYNVGDKSNNQENYEATRTEAEVNNADNQNINQEENNTQTEKDKEQETQQQSEQTQVPVEREIASFSTKIVTKDSSRQNNIRITCNTLNETIVEPGATFSFCNTVGQATTAKGYQKADIFDANGKKKI